MNKPKFEYKTYGTTMVLEGEVDVKTHEELHKRYTQHLVESMRSTREHLMADLLSKPSYEIEVDFDE